MVTPVVLLNKVWSILQHTPFHSDISEQLARIFPSLFWINNLDLHAWFQAVRSHDAWLQSHGLLAPLWSPFPVSSGWFLEAVDLNINKLTMGQWDERWFKKAIKWWFQSVLLCLRPACWWGVTFAVGPAGDFHSDSSFYFFKQNVTFLNKARNQTLGALVLVIVSF